MMFGAQSQKNRCTKVNISFQSLSVISIKKNEDVLCGAYILVCVLFCVKAYCLIIFLPFLM